MNNEIKNFYETIRLSKKIAKILRPGGLREVRTDKTLHRYFFHIGSQVTGAMVCSGDGGVSRKSGCHGDSGGPFVCNIGGRWELHGAVSHGSSRCASTESYTVYARVNHFKKWILANMRS